MGFLSSDEAADPLASCCSNFEQDQEAPARPLVQSEEPRPLHNGREPFYQIKHERLEHRMLMYLKAEGHSNVEIAKITGFSAVAVSNILRQPWAQEEVLRIVKAQGDDAVQQVLKGAALDSVMKLIEIRDDPHVSKETCRKASNDLLDRVFGKPNQPVQHSGNVDFSKVSDEELLKFIPSTSGTGVAATSGDSE